MRLKQWIEIAMILGSMPFAVIMHGCEDNKWRLRECVCLAQPENAALSNPKNTPDLQKSEPKTCHWTDGFGFILPESVFTGEMRHQVPDKAADDQQIPQSKAPTAASSDTKLRKPLKTALAATASVNTGNCIDINTADENQLTSLPGVGKGRAEAIVQARTRKPFKRKKDITRIKGIGVQSYRKMADKICDISDKTI